MASEFNTKEYEWADVEVLLLGRPVTGIRDVKYKASQEKEVLYARGNKGRSIQKGNKIYDGSIMILQSELDALINAAGTDKDALDIPPFDIVIAYEAGGIIKTDIVKNAEFTEFEKGMAQNDKNMEIELPFICLDIQYNV